MRHTYRLIILLIFFVATSFAKEICHSCDGTGKRQCGYCDGRGSMGECYKCQGQGIFDDKCSYCGGQGAVSGSFSNRTSMVACSYCRGTGIRRQKCSVCLGTGLGAKCMTCFGTGKISCKSCYGSGYTPDQMDSIGYYSQRGIYKYSILQNTIPVPMVARQIELDEYTTFSLVASDSIKPHTVCIIFASEESVGDSCIIIHNLFSSDIPLSQERQLQYDHVVKEHKIIGAAEISWEEFERFIKFDSVHISTRCRMFDLEYAELKIISSFHRYLAEHINEEPPPPEFVPFDVDPVIVRRAKPLYPSDAFSAGIQGDVFTKLWVDQSGRVRKVVVVKSTKDIFVPSAIEAAKQWVFTPATLMGKPISVWVSVPFRFRINEGKESNR